MITKMGYDPSYINLWSKMMNTPTDYHTNQRLMFRLIRNLMLGLKCIHSFEIIHNDIKPGNILIDVSNNEGNIKYIDFGLSIDLSKKI